MPSISRWRRRGGCSLAAFRKKTAYGPIFAWSCVCSTTHFREEVVEVGRERYLDLPFLRTNPHLFTQLDTAWVCLTCQAAMSAGRLSTLASTNGLSAPWVGLPPPC